MEPWFLPDYLHSMKYDEDRVALLLSVIGIFSLVPLLSQFISLANCSLYTVWDHVWYGGLPKSVHYLPDLVPGALPHRIGNTTDHLRNFYRSWRICGWWVIDMLHFRPRRKTSLFHYLTMCFFKKKISCYK